MTELSRVMRNGAAASVSRTTCPPEEGWTASAVSVTPPVWPRGAPLVRTEGGDECRHPLHPQGVPTLPSAVWGLHALGARSGFPRGRSGADVTRGPWMSPLTVGHQPCPRHGSFRR